jgi:hypothetical protein
MLRTGEGKRFCNSPMTQPAVDLKGVTLAYGPFVAVKDVDLAVDNGEPVPPIPPSPVAKQWERVPDRAGEGSRSHRKSP